ncbi:MAG TPA: DUF2851 family protein [Chitinophagales bacterium]|nr:DUF2851 family protein [Chitinophagales bacterium]
MQERLLHFIWQNKLFNTKDLKTLNGSELQILDFGKYNTDGGPDFWNAKIKIDDVILIGNIELHIHASDWKLHKHEQDKKYNNVILHVIYFNDEPVSNLPSLELNGRIPAVLLDKYEDMMLSQKDLICENLFDTIDEFTFENWKERLVIERMERKSAEILENLKLNNNDWEQTCYQLLGKYFGSHINKEPFELLTRFLDYKILLKHKEDVFQLEALLFGVAGFLNKDFVEIYPRELKQEYEFLKHKYDLKQIQEHHWQFLRIRPVSFPTIRIAWFAKVMQQMPLLNTILESKEENHFLDNIEVSEYWNEHYVLDKLSKHKSKTLGEDFKSILKINVFAPVLFAYGKYRNDDSYTDKAFQLLYQIHGESNTKTKVFESTKFKHENAFDTQAMIELYDNYCTRKRCLECAIGHKILRTNNPELIANNL